MRSKLKVWTQSSGNSDAPQYSLFPVDFANTTLRICDHVFPRVFPANEDLCLFPVFFSFLFFARNFSINVVFSYVIDDVFCRKFFCHRLLQRTRQRENLHYSIPIAWILLYSLWIKIILLKKKKKFNNK